MLFDNLTKEYLMRDSFNNAGVINLTYKNTDMIYRDDYLLEVAKNKNILHLGFVDHIPLVDEKIRKGNWLHKKLMEVSNLCYGVDINEEGIKYIRDKYKYDNLYVANVTSESIPQELLNTQFDYILIPDVIEHIGNPVEFLYAIRERFKNNTKKIILTTPNAFRWNNFMNVFKSIEVINTDHKFWFTPFTLSKIVVEAGYTINKLSYCEHGKIAKRAIFRRFILNRYYAFRDTLIIEIEL